MKFTEPVEHIFSEGCKDNCGACAECCLSVCKVCGQYEGSLTTHCPESAERAKEHDAYEESWDFRYGNWVEGIRSNYGFSTYIDREQNISKLLGIMLKEDKKSEYIEEVNKELIEILEHIRLIVRRLNKEGDYDYILEDDSIVAFNCKEDIIKALAELSVDESDENIEIIAVDYINGKACV